jgi:hypothetical protein
MNKTFNYGEYMVCLVDILGQKDKLCELKNFPKSAEEKKNTDKILSETAGFVVEFRERFDNLFKNMISNTGVLDSLTPEDRKQAEEARQSDIIYRGFSDTLVISVPIRYINEHCTTMNGVHSSFYAICVSQILSLIGEHTFRGGVDIGLGLEMPSGEVYGPALVSAHYLEKEIAGYPRVLVGDELYNYINRAISLPGDSLFARMTRINAEKSLKMITYDSDGNRMLDFLGEEIHSLAAKRITAEDVNKAYNFICSEEKRFIASGNQKLSERYQKLIEYFESRLELWVH